MAHHCRPNPPWKYAPRPTTISRFNSCATASEGRCVIIFDSYHHHHHNNWQRIRHWAMLLSCHTIMHYYELTALSELRCDAARFPNFRDLIFIDPVLHLQIIWIYFYELKQWRSGSSEGSSEGNISRDWWIDSGECIHSYFKNRHDFCTNQVVHTLTAHVIAHFGWLKIWYNAYCVHTVK